MIIITRKLYKEYKASITTKKDLKIKIIEEINKANRPQFSAKVD
jgi:hypothetical protein